MKKILLLVTILLTGCSTSLGDTPTKAVRKLFDEYQNGTTMAESSLIDDSWTKNEVKQYNKIMKKHYQNMRYDIALEKISGNKAKVAVVIRVTDYSDALSNANVYYSIHYNEFGDSFTFNSYKLDEMEKVTKTNDYVIYVKLKKANDKWKVLKLDKKYRDKLNGIYDILEVDKSDFFDMSDFSRFYPSNGKSTDQG